MPSTPPSSLSLSHRPAFRGSIDQDDDAEGSKPGEESASPELDPAVNPDAATSGPSRSERPPPAPSGTSDPVWASSSPVERFKAPEVPSAAGASPSTPGMVCARDEGRVDGWVDGRGEGKCGTEGARGGIGGQTVAKVEDAGRGGAGTSGVGEKDSGDVKDQQGDGLLVRSQVSPPAGGHAEEESGG